MTCGVDDSDECRAGLRVVSPASATKLMGYSVAELIRRGERARRKFCYSGVLEAFYCGGSNNYSRYQYIVFTNGKTLGIIDEATIYNFVIML